MFSKYYIKNSQPYVIAEIGVNHNCDLKLAKKQIWLAKQGGANAVKFQSYKANQIASVYSDAYWDTNKEKTKSQFELFSKYDRFDENDYFDLYKYCNKIKIDFASTPFDLGCIDYLKKIVKFFKISSSDINNFPLLIKASKANLPMIISTGASNLKEIKEAVNIIRKFNNQEIVIMHCVLSYPTKNHDANLLMIEDLNNKFKNYQIGYSDHTLPCANMLNLITAFLKGAKIIEKHFTHNKNLSGNDHYHAMDFKDLKFFRSQLDKIIPTLGFVNKKVLKCEKKSRRFARRSLVVANNFKKGHTLKLKDINLKRPGDGIEPKYYKKIVGKKLTKNKKYDQILKWSDIK